MRIAAFALVASAALGYAGMNRAVDAAPAPQARACLHGDDELPDQRARRVGALTLARHVNTLQASAASKAGSYQALTSLGVSMPIPEGFRLQLTTDGASYLFSIKDSLDPCMFAYFSDQTGIILVGRVIQ